MNQLDGAKALAVIFDGRSGLTLEVKPKMDDSTVTLNTLNILKKNKMQHETQGPSGQCCASVNIDLRLYYNSLLQRKLCKESVRIFYRVVINITKLPSSYMHRRHKPHKLVTKTPWPTLRKHILITSQPYHHKLSDSDK